MYPLATQEQTLASSPYRADSSQDLSLLVVLGWDEPIQAEDEGEDQPEIEGVEGHGYEFKQNYYQLVLQQHQEDGADDGDVG